MVRTERLIEDLWADEAVGTARNTLQTKVSRLRRALGDGALVTGTSAGYTLQVEPSAVDALEVLRLAEQAPRFEALATRPPRSKRARRRWPCFAARSSPAPVMASGWSRHRARLEEVRLGLIEDQLAARLDLGARRRRDRRARSAGARPSAARGPVGVADGRLVPRWPPSRCARHVPAGPGHGWLTSSVSTLDCSCSNSSNRSCPTTRHSASPYATGRGLGPDAPVGNLPSISVELVGREAELAAVSRSARQQQARRDRRARWCRQDGRRDRRPAAS